MWCRLTLGLVFLVVAASGNVCRGQFSTVIDVPPDSAPEFVGSDTQLNVLGGGLIEEGFNAGLADGTTTNTEVNVTGGSVGAFFNANSGSRVTVSGGIVGVGFDALTGSRVRVLGGTVEDGFNVYVGSDALVTGGSVGSLEAYVRSEAFVAGGSLGRVNAHDESRIHLYGSDFSLDGGAIPFANLGQPETIDERGGALTGTLADGSSINLDLSSDRTAGDDYFAETALLTVTPVSLLAGDYNSNGTVEQADLDLVLLNWGDELFNPYAAGWINDAPDGPIDQGELDKVLLGWGNTVAGALTAAGVPEPSTVVLGAVLLLGVAWSECRHRTAKTRSMLESVSRHDTGPATR